MKEELIGAVDLPAAQLQQARDGLLGLLARPERIEVTKVIPELGRATGGQSLFVQDIDNEAKHAWLKENDKSAADADARLVVLTLVNGDGVPVLSRDHLPYLKRTTALVTKLARLAARVTGMIWDAEEALKNAGTTSPSSGPPPGEVSS